MIQGGCGCWNVMLSYYDQVDEKQRDVAINSCLRPLCSIDGMAVTTVEGLDAQLRLAFHCLAGQGHAVHVPGHHYVGK